MIGQTISYYRITEKLGEGGMGVVYKAEDTQLRRTVALKFLSREAVGNDEIKARLIREAQAAASLDHPNICHVHGIHEEAGQTFIAMAYIDGPSLAKKITERPLPLKEALGIAAQIAEGLNEAHEKGIVHRDVKPHNIMLTAKGQVKIMDFGLASLIGRSKLTKSGTVLGTPAYMAPEQLDASKEVDLRSDIWALGCVLYEMLAQKTPFDAQYEQAIAYGILNEEPEPVSAQRADVSPAIDRLIAKALAKDSAERYQHADELYADLHMLQKAPSRGPSEALSRTQIEEPPARRARLVERAILACSVLAFLILLGVYLSEAPTAPTARAVRRFSVAVGGLVGAVISPDSNYIAYTASDDGPLRLWLHSLSDGSVQPVEGTAGLLGAFWSPDSTAIAFAVGAPEYVLKRISVDGGDALTLCGLPTSSGVAFLGGTWSPDGARIVFSSAGSLYEIPSRGGDPAIVKAVDSARLEQAERPAFLPTEDGSQLIYTKGPDSHGVLVLRDTTSGQELTLGPGRNAVYSPGGFLVHGKANGHEEGLLAMPFSIERLEPTGNSFPVSGAGRQPAVSDDGTLIYADLASLRLRRLVILDRTGAVLRRIGDPFPLGSLEPAISPDGRHVALQRSGDIWIYDVDRGLGSRLPTGGDAHGPAWLKGGEEISYAASADLMIIPRDGASNPRLLASLPALYGAVWSPDGRYLIYAGSDPGGGEAGMWYRKVGSDGSISEAASFLRTPASENAARFSPDGKHVAYQSNESGIAEVYVRSFPSGRDKRQVSIGGGYKPVWSADGSELFYSDGSALFAAQVTNEPSFGLMQPQPLFRWGGLVSGQASRLYDVFPDGQRFLATSLIENADDSPASVRIVQNWYDEFRDREQD